MHTDNSTKKLLDNEWCRMLKRGFDVLFSLCFLCLVFPFVLLVVNFLYRK